MQVSMDWSQVSLEEFFARAWKQGCLTKTEQQTLKERLSNQTLTPDEQMAIQRLLHATRRGWLKVRC